MITVRPYQSSHEVTWNSFNQTARNGHFLFYRNYMEYHSDRFSDASMMIYEDDDPIAILPANRIGENVHSHQGLSFGGLVVGDRGTSARVLEVVEAIRAHLHATGVTRLVYKALPLIYHLRPAQEDIYALTRAGAQLTRRDLTTSINYQLAGQRSQRRDRGARKSRRSGVEVTESARWGEFWSLLVDMLAARHDVQPTHDVDEIQLLAGRFPKWIRLFTAEEAGHVVAGVVMFETATVAHAQYIAASPRGRELGALDQLFDELIARYAGCMRFFDFGISTTESGRVLNEGLVAQKEGFGGSAVVHDVYELDVGSGSADV